MHQTSGLGHIKDKAKQLGREEKLLSANGLVRLEDNCNVDNYVVIIKGFDYF